MTINKLLTIVVSLVLSVPCWAQLPLRQSTASQEVLLPRFVDATDGETEETGLTIANTDLKLWKTGATTLANKNSGGATHISGGLYYTVLDATDTNTLGPLTIDCHPTGALAVRLYCVVLPSAFYDAIYASGAAGNVPANVTQAAGAALGTAATGYLPADARKVDGENLSTHATGYYPADLRMTAGNALAAATSGYVPTEGGGGGSSSELLVDDDSVAVEIGTEEIAITVGEEPDFTLPVGSMVILTGPNGEHCVRHVASGVYAGDGEFEITLDSSPDFTDEGAGTTATVVAVPRQVSLNLDMKVSEAGANAVPTDIDLDPVPTSRTIVLVRKSTGLVGEREHSIQEGGEPETIAVDFRNDAAANQKIFQIDGVEVVSGDENGLTIGEAGREGTQAKFEITGVTAGTYKVRVSITYRTGNTARGDVTVKVVE